MKLYMTETFDYPILQKDQIISPFTGMTTKTKRLIKPYLLQILPQPDIEYCINSGISGCKSTIEARFSISFLKGPSYFIFFRYKDQKPSATNKSMFITNFTAAGYRTLHDIVASVFVNQNSEGGSAGPSRLVSRPTPADAHRATPGRELTTWNCDVCFV